MEYLSLLVIDMKTREESINEILAKWNPIDVPENIAKTEYINFIPSIKRRINSEAELIYCLEDILTNKLELDYNSANPLHKEELKEVARKITHLTQV